MFFSYVNEYSITGMFTNNGLLHNKKTEFNRKIFSVSKKNKVLPVLVGVLSKKHCT